MCRWMGSHFHDWIDYYGVAFCKSYWNGVVHFQDFGGQKIQALRDLKNRKVYTKLSLTNVSVHLRMTK